MRMLQSLGLQESETSSWDGHSENRSRRRSPIRTIKKLHDRVLVSSLPAYFLAVIWFGFFFSFAQSEPLPPVFGCYTLDDKN